MSNESREYTGTGLRMSPVAGPGLAVWFTGLSGAGKTTVCNLVADRLRAGGHRVEVLDGDVVRAGLSRGLGFSKEDRDENVRRLGSEANRLARGGAVVLVAAISPYRAGREENRRLIGRYIEVYVNAPLEACERRDPRGLYRKARSGEIGQFTGVSDPYEAPVDAEVECPTDSERPEESADRVCRAVRALLAGAS